MLKRFGYSAQARLRQGRAVPGVLAARPVPRPTRPTDRRPHPGAARRGAAVLLAGGDHARPPAATLAFGIRLMPLDQQQRVIEDDAQPARPAAGRARRSSSGSRCSRPRPTRRCPRTGAAAARCARRPARASRSCCSRCSAAPARAGAAGADRAGDRLVGARALPDSGPAEPDVGHARRAGGRDLDRVQRAALASATARSATAGHERAEALRRTYRSTGAAVLASGATAIAGFAVLVVSDIRMLRDFGDRDGGRPDRVAARRAGRPAGGARARRARRAADAARAGCDARAAPPALRAARRRGRAADRERGPLDFEPDEDARAPTRRAGAQPAEPEPAAAARAPPARRSRYGWFVGRRRRSRWLAYIALNTLRTDGPGSRGVPTRARAAAVRRAARAARTSTGDANVARGPTRAARASAGVRGARGRRSSTSASSPSAARSCWPSWPRAAAGCRRQLDRARARARAASPASSSPRWRSAATAATCARSIRDHGWRFPVGYDRDGEVANLYGVAVCPHDHLRLSGRDRHARPYAGTRSTRRAGGRVGELVTGSERRGWRPPDGERRAEPERGLGRRRASREEFPELRADRPCTLDARPGRSAAARCASACASSPTAFAARRR